MEEEEQGALVVRLEGLAPQQGKPADVGAVQGLQKRLLGLGGKGLAVAEVPGLGLEAALAAVGAARDKEGHPHPGAVGDVAGLDAAVVHWNRPPYRWSTRSLISWVRPWFQNWVPM